jgi:hypothetical protein
MELINKINLYYDNNYPEMSNKKMIQLVRLEREDIERSEIVRRMIDIYNYKYVEKIHEDKAIKNQIVDKELDEKPKELYKKNIINNNDAALMPIHHLKSKNLNKF